MAKTAGWFGKIPFLGDFASRRLVGEFIDAWDRWLQHSMAASRASLGERWLDIYLTSPIWRFALMPAVIGRNAWAGILMPSVDNVGRHFPFTLALELDAESGPHAWAVVLHQQSWYARLEEVALGALDVNCAPDDIERALEGIPLPEQAANNGDVGEVAVRLAQWWRAPSQGADPLVLRDLETMLSALATTAEHVFETTASGRSFWWSRDASAGATELHCQIGLPHEDYFARLLQGTPRLQS